MTASPRHLLVVATQCEDMPHLERLDDAARDLAEALLDAEAGACVPALPDGRALCLGPLEADRVQAIVTLAADRARNADATLVLAFLGHGFTIGDISTLYYMGWKSQQGIANTAVDVNSMLQKAVLDPRVDGVVAVIDTCQAAAALPDSRELIAADKSLGVLMACKAQEPASDLRLSRALADLLRSGLDGGESRIHIAAAVPVLQRAAPGQTIVPSAHHGNQLTANPLWLGWNPRTASRLAAEEIGPLGRARLESVRSAYPPGAARPEHLWDDGRLFEVKKALAARPRSQYDERLLKVLIKLHAAAKTVELLRSLSELTTTRLRSALTALLAAEDQLSSTGDLSFDLVDVVDYVVFNHPATEVDHRRWLTRFVALLAAECPQLDAERTRRWAVSLSAEVQLADAREFASASSRDRTLRLVVSAHSWAGDWPERLETWILLNGELPAVGDDEFRTWFECPTVGKDGAESALAAAVAWGKRTAQRRGLELRHVDVAAPSAVLVQWRPEEALVDGELLGVNYTVVTHWSPRFDPPEPPMPPVDVALRRLARIEAAFANRLAWLAWLASHETCKPDDLLHGMRVGRYQKAIAVDHRLSAENIRLVNVLCAYVPIVLWWSHPTIGIGPVAQTDVEQFWGELPAGFLKAYRKRWSGEDPVWLANFRALWDDRQWLAFCQKIAGI